MSTLTDPVRGLTVFDGPLASPTAELSEIASTMHDATTDALLVERRDGRVAVLTEYDVVKGVAGGDLNIWATDVMSREVIEVDADMTIIDAVELMHGRGIRHLVVRDGDEVGILCLTDCIAPLLAAAHGGGEPDTFVEELQ